MPDTILNHIREKAEQYFPEVQGIRHYLHANPELSFKEYTTAAYIAETLATWGIEYQDGVAGTGIVVVLEGKNPGKKCVAIRGELDALPIQEANDALYKSANDGVMHACGHDVHTSCALGVIRILNDLKDEWEGTLKVLFQPGEEKDPGGASIMIKEGVLDNPKPSAIFALHVYPHLPSGTVGFHPGQYMASADEVYITIEGRGGHAALPHLTTDTIAISALVISGLQQVISRKGNPIIPSVLTFGKIQGGFTTNVIPDKVEIMGTFRTMDETWRYEAHKWIKDFTEKTCEAYGTKATVEIPAGYPSLFNDPKLTGQSELWAKEYLGSEYVHPLNIRMTADDFAFYSQYMPSCYFRLGTSKNNEQFTVPVHNAHFDIDEDAIRVGMGTMAWIVVNALGKERW
jgi:amidohydrolase